MADATTPTVSRQKLDEAKRLVEELKKTNAVARNVNSTPATTIVEGQTAPPAYVKSLNDNQKPISFMRLMNFIGTGDDSVAPHEAACLRMYKKAMQEHFPFVNVNGGNTWWVPTDFNTYAPAVTSSKNERDYQYVKSVFAASNSKYDPDEARWLAKRGLIVKANTTTQSAYDQGIGEELVAPPIQGDVIPLIRPQAAFLAAGAQAMTLPPNGRYVAPRITAAPIAQATTEGGTSPSGQLGTDSLEMTAKKISGVVNLTEEGTAFTSGTLDNIAQMELGRTLGLQLDAYGFYGNGGPNEPNGITSDAYANLIYNVEIQAPLCKGVGTNGNQLLPQYGDIFPAQIAERSFNMDAATGAWVMRPGPFSTAVSLRADAVAANDQAGVQVDILRRFADYSPTSWKGRKVVQSTNIRNIYTKGGGTNLSDVFFGIWQYAIFASYGAIQFQQGYVNSQFTQGIVSLRAVMYGDIGFQYPGAFLWYPNVIGLNNNF